MPKTRIGNRSYPPAVSDEQRSVMSGLLNDPGWQRLTQIGNRSYGDETTGSAPPPYSGKGITYDLHGYASGLGKTANDLSLDELNDFIDRHYGAQPQPKQMYKLPSNY